MNPYLKINKSIGLQKNENSLYYGRFRLSFDQVYPFRYPKNGCVYIKIKKEHVEDARIIIELLPDHIYLFHFEEQEYLRPEGEGRNGFEIGDYYCRIEMASNVIYIAMENVYFTLLELVPYLEDFQFFVFSTGDGNDRWLEEYTNKKGQLTCDRGFCETEPFYGVNDNYIKKVDSNPEDRDFKFFTTWKLYERLNWFSVRWKQLGNAERAEMEFKMDEIFFKACDNDIRLDHFYTDLKNFYHNYMNNRKDGSVSLDPFINWRSENEI